MSLRTVLLEGAFPRGHNFNHIGLREKAESPYFFYFFFGGGGAGWGEGGSWEGIFHQER